MAYKNPKKESDLQAQTIHVRRVSRTVSTRKIMSFAVTAIIFDNKRRLGLVSAKALSSTDAVQKAKKLLLDRKLDKFYFIGNTIPYKVTAKYNSTIVTLIPAGQGTGLVACKTIRSISDALQVENILSKVHGSHNPINVARATIKAFKQCRPYSYYANKRNKTLTEIFQ